MEVAFYKQISRTANLSKTWLKRRGAHESALAPCLCLIPVVGLIAQVCTSMSQIPAEAQRASTCPIRLQATIETIAIQPRLLFIYGVQSCIEYQPVLHFDALLYVHLIAEGMSVLLPNPTLAKRETTGQYQVRPCTLMLRQDRSSQDPSAFKYRKLACGVPHAKLKVLSCAMKLQCRQTRQGKRQVRRSA